MNIKSFYHNPVTGNVTIQIEYQHMEYNTVLVLISTNIKSGSNIKIRKVFVEGMRIPYQKHKELEKEIKQCEELKQFILKHVSNYKERLSTRQNHELLLKSVSVLSTRTDYIRSVDRNGSNLNHVVEVRKEEHSMALAVFFQGIEEEIHMKLMYRENYRIKIKQESLRFIQPYLTENWEENLLEKILPTVKEKVTFLLP